MSGGGLSASETSEKEPGLGWNNQARDCCDSGSQG